LKEAIVKASGNRSIYFPGVYLHKASENTKPLVQIEGDVNKKIMYDELQVSNIHSSISHEDLFAIAFVLLETMVSVG
jgi:phosphopantetheinyl transferase (holo-ACP synthase)